MEIINLNGTEYIKRDTVKKMEQELTDLKKIMEQINNLSTGMPTDTVSRHKRVNVDDDAVFVIPKSAREKWSIRLMDEDGKFFSKMNKELKFTIKDVLIANNVYSDKMTVKEAKFLKKRLNVNGYVFNRLIYNLSEGVFAKFIHEWNEKHQPVISKWKLPTENNPEKRKESVLYG